MGAGGGEGVFVNKQTGQRTYFTVSCYSRAGIWKGASEPKQSFNMTAFNDGGVAIPIPGTVWLSALDYLA